MARAFLEDEWRRGRLDGATADEAFRRDCDESSNLRTEVAEATNYTGVIEEPSDRSRRNCHRQTRPASGCTGVVEFGVLTNAWIG